MKNKFLGYILVVMLMLTTNIFGMAFAKDNPVLFIFNEKYGLLNDNLEVVVVPEYDRGLITTDKEFVVLGKKNNLDYNFSVMNFNGEILFSKETKFNGLKNIAGNQLYFESLNKNENDVIYFPSENKKIILAEKLYNIYSVTNTFELPDFIASGKYYYDINQQKKIFADKDFLHVLPMVDGVAVVVDKNFEKKIINDKGEIIFEEVINCARNFTEGLLAVKCKNKSGFINKTGKMIFECSIYPDGSDSPKGTPNLNCAFSEGLVYVPTQKDSWSLFNKRGKIIKDNLKYYPSGNIYSEGMLQVYDKGKNKYGYLNAKGDIEIPFVFDKATSFNNGYANVIYDGKEALIDLKGNLFFSEDLINGNKISKLHLK